MNKYRVYSYICLITGQRYIGCTCIPYQSTRAGKNGNRYVCKGGVFGETIKKYGWENFKYEVIEDNLTKEDALLKENLYICIFNTLAPNGFNLESGGTFGKTVNNLTKKKFNSLAVNQFDMNGNFIRSWSSIYEASKAMNTKNKIADCCHNRKKSYKGFLWRFA